MIIMSHKAENVNIQCNGLTSLDYSLFSNWVLFRGTKKAIEWWWVCHQYFKIKRFCQLQTCLLLTRLYEELIASVVPRSQLKMGSHWLRSDFLCVITTFIIINDNHINHHHRHHQYQSQSSSSSSWIPFGALSKSQVCEFPPFVCGWTLLWTTWYFFFFHFWGFFHISASLYWYIDIVVNCLMAMTMCNCICRTFGVLVSYLLYLTFLFKISLQSWNFDFGHF